MSIRDDARQEAERRYPALNPDTEELTYPRSAIRRMTREAFVAGAVWRDGQIDRGCGHPNHGAEEHDCAPFLPDRERDQYAAEPVAYALYEKTGKHRGEWVLFTHAVSARDRRVYDVRPLYAHPETPEPTEREKARQRREEQNYG